jgi:hypothetical protein
MQMCKCDKCGAIIDNALKVTITRTGTTTITREYCPDCILKIDVKLGITDQIG